MNSWLKPFNNLALRAHLLDGDCEAAIRSDVRLGAADGPGSVERLPFLDIMEIDSHILAGVAEDIRSQLFGRLLFPCFKFECHHVFRLLLSPQAAQHLGLSARAEVIAEELIQAILYGLEFLVSRLVWQVPDSLEIQRQHSKLLARPPESCYAWIPGEGR